MAEQKKKNMMNLCIRLVCVLYMASEIHKIKLDCDSTHILVASSDYNNDVYPKRYVICHFHTMVLFALRRFHAHFLFILLLLLLHLFWIYSFTLWARKCATKLQTMTTAATVAKLLRSRSFSRFCIRRLHWIYIDWKQPKRSATTVYNVRGISVGCKFEKLIRSWWKYGKSNN